jgi:hypothetical protein
MDRHSRQSSSSNKNFSITLAWLHLIRPPLLFPCLIGQVHLNIYEKLKTTHLLNKGIKGKPTFHYFQTPPTDIDISPPQVGTPLFVSPFHSLFPINSPLKQSNPANPFFFFYISL